MGHSFTPDDGYEIPDEILHPNSRFLFNYWDQLRGIHNAPLRNDIELKQLQPIIRNMCIIERDHLQPDYSWRLAGTGLYNIWGRELTGHSLFAQWPVFERKSLTHALDLVVDSYQPAVARLRLEYPIGKPTTCEFLALPIRKKQSSTIRVLGSLSSFTPPRWLGKALLNNIELIGLRTVRLDPPSGDKPASMLKVSMVPKPDPRKFLRLIQGGLSDK